MVEKFGRTRASAARGCANTAPAAMPQPTEAREGCSGLVGEACVHATSGRRSGPSELFQPYVTLMCHILTQRAFHAMGAPCCTLSWEPYSVSATYRSASCDGNSRARVHVALARASSLGYLALKLELAVSLSIVGRRVRVASPCDVTVSMTRRKRRTCGHSSSCCSEHCSGRVSRR